MCCLPAPHCTPILYAVFESSFEFLPQIAWLCDSNDYNSRRGNLTDLGSGQVHILDPVYSGQVFTTADLGQVQRSSSGSKVLPKSPLGH